MHQETTAAKVVSSGEGSKRSEQSEMKIIGAKNVCAVVLSDWANEKDDMVGIERWDKEKDGGEKVSVV